MLIQYCYFSVPKEGPFSNAVKETDVNKMWFPNVDLNHGFCYTFDIHQVDKYENGVAIKDTGNPYITFEFPAKWVNTTILFFHNSYDLPDAGRLHNFLKVRKLNNYQVSITKKVVESVSTKRKPCQKFARETCIRRYLFKQILETYECKMALNYNGLYLDEEPFLSNEVFNGKEEWKKLMEKTELCSVAIHATIYENYGNLTSRFKMKCPRYESSHVYG